MVEYKSELLNNYPEYDELELNYINRIARYPRLSSDEEKELGYSMLNNDIKAKKMLFLSNIRLVISASKKYKRHGSDTISSIQAGCVGLSEAINRFDVKKNAKFSSYAMFYIRKMIKEHDFETRNIKISEKTYYCIQQIIRIKNMLSIKLGKEPTIEEIANEIGIKKETVMRLLNISNDTLSLNECLVNLKGDEDKKEEIDVLIDESANTEEIVILNELKEDMTNLINNAGLNEKERLVLIYRYGLNNNKILTLESIGKIFGFTKQYASKLEKSALTKLRKIIDIEKMSIYLDNPDEGKKRIKSLLK